MVIKELKYTKKQINCVKKENNVKGMSLNSIDISLRNIYKEIVNDIDDFTTVVMCYDNNPNILEYVDMIRVSTDNICVLVSQDKLNDLESYTHIIVESKYYIYILENSIGTTISNLLSFKCVGTPHNKHELFDDEFLEDTLDIELPKQNTFKLDELVNKSKTVIGKVKKPKFSLPKIERHKREKTKGEKIVNILLLLAILGVLILLLYTLNQPFVSAYL